MFNLSFVDASDDYSGVYWDITKAVKRKSMPSHKHPVPAAGRTPVCRKKTEKEEQADSTVQEGFPPGKLISVAFLKE